MGKPSWGESDDDWSPDEGLSFSGDGRRAPQAPADVDARSIISGRQLIQPGLGAAHRSRALAASEEITLQDLQARGSDSVQQQAA